MTEVQNHDYYLQKALEVAEQAKGQCAPNPAVAALLVKQDKVIAKGLHRGFGLAHAERDLLMPLTLEQTKGTDLYVTLEPCCHYGKTPPCSRLITQKQIARVFYGMRDPNPKVAGQGIADLQAAGIQCQQVAKATSHEFYESYLYWWRTGLPYTTFKLAITLDAKIAHSLGKACAISSAQTNQVTHRMRKQSDAILTTARTVISDDPQLNVRCDGHVQAKPVYVIDRDLTLPLNARLLSTAARLVVFHRQGLAEEKTQAFLRAGVNCRVIPLISEQQLDLSLIWQSIGKDGVHNLWLESGGIFLTEIVKTGLLNKALLDIAPKMLGQSAYPAFHSDQDLFATAKSKRWHLLGEDVMLEIRW